MNANRRERKIITGQRFSRQYNIQPVRINSHVHRPLHGQTLNTVHFPSLCPFSLPRVLVRIQPNLYHHKDERAQSVSLHNTKFCFLPCNNKCGASHDTPVLLRLLIHLLILSTSSSYELPHVQISPNYANCSVLPPM
jgi:hypothetical protein